MNHKLHFFSLCPLLIQKYFIWWSFQSWQPLWFSIASWLINCLDKYNNFKIWWGLKHMSQWDKLLQHFKPSQNEVHMWMLLALQCVKFIEEISIQKNPFEHKKVSGPERQCPQTYWFIYACTTMCVHTHYSAFGCSFDGSLLNVWTGSIGRIFVLGDMKVLSVGWSVCLWSWTIHKSKSFDVHNQLFEPTEG